MTMYDSVSPRRNGATRVIRSAPLLAFSVASLAMVASPSAARAATITVDASKQTAGNPHFWSEAFGTGKAKLALRGDWQTHYKIGNRELGAKRVRGHGLLNSGEMDLWKAAGQYDWKNLDAYLFAITSANMVPLIELDFMPKGLATNTDKSPPKDYDEWKNFIKALTQHLVDKHGMDEVKKWYFEVWNEPDYLGFWEGTDMNAYYKLYDNTVDALTAVIPNVLVGGPSTTGPGAIKAFLQHCKSANKRVTFVSSHVYPGGDNKGTVADAAGLMRDNESRVSGITGAGYSTADVKSFNTEWNSSYSGQGGNAGDAVTSMDNHWNVGFILKGIKLLSDQNKGDTPPVEIFSYWALSDVFDEDGGTDGIHMTTKPNQPFGTVFGIMTFQGMRKAAFNAFKMLNYLGPKRLQSAGGTGGDGVDAMATTSESGDSLQILVYNYFKTLNTASGSGESVTINVSNLPAALANKQVYVTQFIVDEKNSNPYSVWQGQNKPSAPTEEQWRAMRHAQHLALMQPVTQKQVETSFSTTFTLLRQSGSLIIVSTKRPVTGRNALVEIEGEDFDGQSPAANPQSIKQESGDSTTVGQSISVASGASVYYENVDYTDDGVTGVEFRVKTASDINIELHAEKQDGALLAKCAVTSTSNAWATQKCTLTAPAKGMSTLYLVFSGAANLNWFKFTGGGTNPGTGGSSGSTGGTSVSNGGAGGSAGGGATGRGGSTGSAAGGASGSGAGGAGTGGGSTVSGNGGAASGGEGGASGSGSGGSSSSGAGGSSGSSGSNGSGGVSGGSTTPPGSSSSGCSCRIGEPRGASGALVLIGLVAAVVGMRAGKTRRRK